MYSLQVNKRKSNIELLRLLSMLMILNLHSFWGYRHGSGLLQAIDFFRECTSICAVDVFILISGYFSIKWKLKSFYNLVFQIFFYSFSVYGLSILFGFVSFNKNDFFHCFKALYSSWGFITSYIIMYFASPCMNSFVERTSSRRLLIYILVIFFAENFVFYSRDVINFCLLYLLGRWLYKTNAIHQLANHPIKKYWFITFCIFTLTYSMFLFCNFKVEKIQSLFVGLNYAAPLVILQAVFLFISFAKINLNSNFINWCSVSCLSIFLIHMHPAIKNIGYYAYTENLYDKPLCEHILILFALMIVVFVGSIIIDKVRIFFLIKYIPSCH